MVMFEAAKVRIDDLRHEGVHMTEWITEADGVFRGGLL